VLKIMSSLTNIQYTTSYRAHYRARVFRRYIFLIPLTWRDVLLFWIFDGHFAIFNFHLFMLRNRLVCFFGYLFQCLLRLSKKIMGRRRQMDLFTKLRSLFFVFLPFVN